MRHEGERLINERLKKKISNYNLVWVWDWGAQLELYMLREIELVYACLLAKNKENYLKKFKLLKLKIHF